MELYDPPIAVTAEHDIGPHQPMNGYPGGNPPSCLEKGLTWKAGMLSGRIWLHR
jgi:hypothetical protein